jgi:hypothetical protein
MKSENKIQDRLNKYIQIRQKYLNDKIEIEKDSVKFFPSYIETINTNILLINKCIFELEWVLELIKDQNSSNEPVFIPIQYVSDNFTDEEIIINSFESEYGIGAVTIKQRLEFAINLSKEGKYSKEFIFNVLKNKKN